jgi:hypothetical protein
MTCPICKTDLPHPVYLGDGIGTCKGVTKETDGWTARAARQIMVEGDRLRSALGCGLIESEIVAIITAHAEPLVTLLREARRGDHEPGCMAGWAQVGVVYEDKRCSCAAGEWNARIDAILESK